MTTTTTSSKIKSDSAGHLPLTDIVTPADQQELREIVRQAFESRTALYPLGGGTSLDFGLAPKRSGIGVSLAGLNRIVDYPAGDMTITVEAGLTMAALAAALNVNSQRLPVDAPRGERATVGGMIATNHSGPRRFGCGTLRDYVIGISAVDGRGVAFKGGGRVVKNVAGYDFPKLLTGSLGTLAIIDQATLKVKPAAQASAIVTCELNDAARAEPLLAALVHSATTPVAVELVAGPMWRDADELAVVSAGVFRVAVGLEGTPDEVDWMVEQVCSEWHEQGITSYRTLRHESASRAWSRLVEFAALDGSALTLKLNVLPSRVISIIELCRELDRECSIQAHAGSGIVIVHLSKFSPGDVSRVLIGRLQPAAAAAGGNVIVLACSEGELTRQATWGAASADAELMRVVKNQFDPEGLLNPGRFVYGTG